MGPGALPAGASRAGVEMAQGAPLRGRRRVLTGQLLSLGVFSALAPGTSWPPSPVAE